MDTDVEAHGATLPVERDRGFAMGVVLVPARLLLVVPVELASERHTIAAVVQRRAGDREEPAARPAAAGFRAP